MAGWLLMWLVSAIGSPLRGEALFFVPRGAVTLVQGVFLASAMKDDVQTQTERHWSHWLGACAWLVMYAAYLIVYAYYSIFPRR
jgi:hypothetical protein